MNHRAVLFASIFALICLSASSALAQVVVVPNADEPVEPNPDQEAVPTAESPAVLLPGTSSVEPDDNSNKVASGIGFAATIGVGALWYTDSSINERLDIGPTWDARLAVGTRWPVTLEFSYTGSLNNIEDPNNNLALISHGLDGKIRAQLPFDSLFMPYVFGGAGWRNYDVHNFDDGETATIGFQDDVLEAPVGAGIALRYSNLLFDLRGTYRFSFFAEENESSDQVTISDNNFSNLSAVLSGGFEF